MNPMPHYSLAGCWAQPLASSTVPHHSRLVLSHTAESLSGAVSHVGLQDSVPRNGTARLGGRASGLKGKKGRSEHGW